MASKIILGQGLSASSESEDVFSIDDVEDGGNQAQYISTSHAQVSCD